LHQNIGNPYFKRDGGTRIELKTIGGRELEARVGKAGQEKEWRRNKGCVSVVGVLWNYSILGREKGLRGKIVRRPLAKQKEKNVEGKSA